MAKKYEPCEIEIRNPLPEYAEVEIVRGDAIIERTIVGPFETSHIPVLGPEKYDVRVRLLQRDARNKPSAEELRPASFTMLERGKAKTAAIETEEPEPEEDEVPMRSMADMFRELEEKEAATR